MKQKPEAGVGNSGRQRRPSGVGTGVFPTHPRGTPNRIGRPAPAELVVMEPAAIMERRPAPRISRQPIPSAIRVKPATAIHIWLPPRIEHRHRGLPARAAALDIDPVSVR